MHWEQIGASIYDSLRDSGIFGDAKPGDETVQLAAAHGLDGKETDVASLPPGNEAFEPDADALASDAGAVKYLQGLEEIVKERIRLGQAVENNQTTLDAIRKDIARFEAGQIPEAMRSFRLNWHMNLVNADADPSRIEIRG